MTRTTPKQRERIRSLYATAIKQQSAWGPWDEFKDAAGKIVIDLLDDLIEAEVELGVRVTVEEEG